MKWPSAELSEGTTLKLPDGWLPPEYYDAINVLFRVENALRVFVYIVLKNAHGSSWHSLSLSSDDSNASTIASIARQREEQDRKYGYLGTAVSAPLMYLTSGELIRLMLSDREWPHFAGYFVAPRNIIQTKLEEIGNIRNALAHFRPLTHDDVQLVKTNARHVLVEVERYIECIFNPMQIVPTNSQEAWYASLQAMPTGSLAKVIAYSTDEQWVAINLQFECVVLRPSIESPFYANPGLLYLESAAILRAFPKIRDYVTCIAETHPRQHGGPGPNDFVFRMSVSLIFSRHMLESNHTEIAGLVATFCSRVGEESNLVQQDELARGGLVRMINLIGRKRKLGDSDHWAFDLAMLSSKVAIGDGSEYWGVQNRFARTDWISETRDYPWTPQPLGLVEEPLPF